MKSASSPILIFDLFVLCRLTDFQYICFLDLNCGTCDICTNIPDVAFHFKKIPSQIFKAKKIE